MPAPIQDKWAAHGGASGPIGQPTAAAVAGNGYCYQSFEGGFISAILGPYAQWTPYIVLKNSGATGPRWYAIAGAAGAIPISDETYVANGSYQRFMDVGPATVQYIFAPTGGTPFEAGYKDLSAQTLDDTMTVLNSAENRIQGNWGSVLYRFGVPGAPASCTLTRGGCEMYFGAKAWRYLMIPGGPTGGGYQPASPLGQAYAARGAENGPLGFPDAAADCLSADCRIWFENADLSQYQGQVHLVANPFRSATRAIATTDAVCGLAHDLCRQSFVDSIVYADPWGGMFFLTGSFKDRWLALGGETGPLGFPVGNPDWPWPSPLTNSRYSVMLQHFTGGLLASPNGPGDPISSVDMVKGAILTKYLHDGPEAVGPPLGDEVCTGPGGGCYQWFKEGVYSRGTIWLSPTKGAFTVRDDGLQQLYEQRDWAWGPMGYPLGDIQCTGPDGGCYQWFEGGIAWKGPPMIAGQTWVHGGIGAKYAQLNWAWGPLGYPHTEELCGTYANGGCAQYFDNGQILWSPASGASMIRGAISAGWFQTGYYGGIGYPTQDEQCVAPNGGCYQWFQNGLFFWSPGTGAHYVHGGIGATYASLNWAWGGLGYPTTNEYSNFYGETEQDFQGGSIIWTPWRGTQVIWH